VTLNEFQVRALNTAIYTYPDYPFVALAEEAGEALGKLAKCARKQGVPVHEALHLVDKQEVAKELFDVLWNVACCAVELGYSLEDLAELGLAKLEDRAKRGVLNGEGDNR
jgi:NTP pyrophosphatase (non-canonical NTP hydrolase)